MRNSRLLNTMRLASLGFWIVAVMVLTAFYAADGMARMRSADAMAEAASRFLDSLSAAQRARASIGFDDERRTIWHFIPQKYEPPRSDRVRLNKGVAFKEFTPAQRTLALELLRSGVSAAGYDQATAIMNLETVLREIEERAKAQGQSFADAVRDPENYYYAVYGTPAGGGTWGWSVEGHHVSINLTAVGGRVVSNTPLFFGSDPAEVRMGDRKGLRLLAAEEDRARALLEALDPKQRAMAIVSADAPEDLLTYNLRRADPLYPPQPGVHGMGIAAAQLTQPQKDLLNAIIDEYLSNMREDVRAERSKQVRSADFDRVRFAWAGGARRGEKHYYRVQGDTFLIEYDNTQDNGNHIHSVWRDFDGDFGEDVLREHYAAYPHATGARAEQ
jgi:Protein of unknown function (DUF3500)